MIQVLQHPTVTNLFTINKIPYSKGSYEVYVKDDNFRNIGENLDQNKIYIGIRHKIKRNMIIQNPAPLKSYVSIFGDNYTDLDMLLKDITGIIEINLESATVMSDDSPTDDLLTEIRDNNLTQNTSFDGLLQEVVDIHDKLTGSERSIDLVSETSDGATDAGVQSVSILFLGNNGTLNGVPVNNNFNFSFTSKGEDTIGSMSFTVPTSGQQKVIISYVR